MKAKTAPVLYHCDDCGNAIAATAEDPVHKPGSHTLCQTCIRKAPPIDTAPKAKKPDGRGAAAKARWEAMTPAQRKERVRKLQAGRKLQREEAP